MSRGGALIRGAVGLTVATVALLVAAAPAFATWTGSLLRASSNPDSGALLLKVHASTPSFGLHFGLNRGGFTVSNVSSSAPGPTLNGQQEPACTPTNNSGVTTKKAGIDCSFGSAVSDVTITFTTSPRYPTNAGGETFDDQDSSTATVPGPPPSEMEKFDMKELARTKANYAHSEALRICFEGNPGEQAFGAIFTGFYFFIAEAAYKSCVKEAEAAYKSALAAIDPVDQNFSAVALPVVRSVRTLGRTRCGTRGARRPAAACRKAAALELRWIQENARLAAIWGAVDTTLNRLNTADANGSATGDATQNAALAAYGGELLAAYAAQDATDAALARVLRKLRLDPRLSAKQLGAERRSFDKGRLPAAVKRALAADGISSARFAAVIKRLGTPPPAPLDIVGLLRARELSGPAVANVRADWRSLTGQDLIALVNGLAIAQAIDQQETQRLDNDANQIDQAPAGSARRSAAQQFVRDARQAEGEAATLLETAGNALT